MTINRAVYPGIPEDFPIEDRPFALSGSQPKLNLVQEGDMFYAAGTSPGEVQAAYEGLTDLAEQVLTYCRGESLATPGDVDAMLERESQILKVQLHVQPSHVDWVMTRVRALLKEAGHPALIGDSSGLASDSNVGDAEQS